MAAPVDVTALLRGDIRIGRSKLIEVPIPNAPDAEPLTFEIHELPASVIWGMNDAQETDRLADLPIATQIQNQNRRLAALVCQGLMAKARNATDVEIDNLIENMPEAVMVEICTHLMYFNGQNLNEPVETPKEAEPEEQPVVNEDGDIVEIPDGDHLKKD